MKNFRIVLQLILVTILFAQTYSFSGGDGSLGNPYNISTCDHLQNISSDLTANYQLVANIDCSSLNFEPLGSCTGACTSGGDDVGFSGTFQGNYYTINNLNIVNTTTSNTGWALFSFLEGDVNNLNIENLFINVTGNYSAGLAGGIRERSSLENISIQGRITGNNVIGGLFAAGLSVNPFDQFTFKNVRTDIVLNGNDYIGGISGSQSLRIYSYNISSRVDITGNNYVGGISGSMIGDPYGYDSTYSIGTITGNNYVGGFAGRIIDGTARDTYFIGSVNGSDYVGGLFGIHEDSGSPTFEDISNSFVVANVTGTGPNVGTISGNEEGPVTNMYYFNYSSNPVPYGVNPGSGTATIVNDLSFFSNTSNALFSGNWDTNIWDFNGSLPVLRWEATFENNLQPDPVVVINNEEVSLFVLNYLLSLGAVFLYFILF